jgi:lysophospholipase L1-like esterase
VLKKIALSLVSLLAALLAAELLIRALGAAPEVGVIRKGRFQLSRNPKIGYEPVPGLHYEGEELSFYDYQGSSNSLGYRDVDHAVAKPPGVYRIAVLGDSVAAGLRVERYEDTFPAILERLLREQGVRAEVMSFAVSGYNTQQEVETLKDKALRFQPDLVLLAYVLNDREQMDGGILATLLESERRAGGLSSARVNPVLAKSALYRFVALRVLRPGTKAAVGGVLGGDTVAASFAELAAVARREKLPVLVAVFPRYVRWYGLYRFRGEHEQVAALSRRYGFHHLDLLNDIRTCKSAGEPLSFDAFHPNALGHRCAAAALARAILKDARPPRGKLSSVDPVVRRGKK